jgi:hypothetical protein
MGKLNAEIRLQANAYKGSWVLVIAIQQIYMCASKNIHKLPRGTQMARFILQTLLRRPALAAGFSSAVWERDKFQTLLRRSALAAVFSSAVWIRDNSPAPYFGAMSTVHLHAFMHRRHR